MSGGLVNLVSKGIQDSFLISGSPDSSLFRMRYTRHSNFSQIPHKISELVIPANSTRSIEITNKGDLLTYMWLEGDDMFSQFSGCTVELRIGGQVVDRQSSTFLTDVWPVYMSDTYTKASVINNSTSSSNKNFQPFHFFFNDNWQNIPLVALQYHTVELVITTRSNPLNAKLYGNFVFVDEQERAALVDGPKQFIITQVQEFFTDSTSIDLSHLNHPVRSLFWGTTARSSDMSRDFWTFTEADLYLNGTPYFENMSPTYFHSVQGYFHTPTGMINMDPVTNTPFFTRFYSYNFCMNSSSYKPTGSCNFSRMDNAKLVIKGLSTGSNHGNGIHVIAVNYNVLKIDRGLCGVLFSN
jgi:hypothetical protein